MSARHLALLWESRAAADGDQSSASDASFSSTSSSGENHLTSSNRFPRRVSAGKPPRPPPRPLAAHVIVVRDDDVDDPTVPLQNVADDDMREIQRLEQILAKMDDDVRMLEETVQRQTLAVGRL